MYNQINNKINNEFIFIKKEFKNNNDSNNNLNLFNNKILFKIV